MALQQVPPLSREQYNFVTDKLDSKPTKKQKERTKRAVEEGRKIKTIAP